LQAPLYVGKASNLRRRIGEHVTGASSLLERLRTAEIGIETCLLRYKYVQPEELSAIYDAAENGKAGDQVMSEVTLLIEELLTRLSPSAFVRRPG
jgi:hypothetical protein